MLFEDIFSFFCRRLWDLINIKNRHAPVFKLSDEMLGFNFVLARDASDKPWRMLLAITHVCKDWRKFAINMPLLWTRFLDSARPKWTKLSLERALRAPTAPLEIELYMCSKSVEIGRRQDLLNVHK